MKHLELFSGYGTSSFALKKLGIKSELIGYSDIDKYANKCFQQNHGGKELGDVRLIEPTSIPDFDYLSAGFPCQPFSNAGKQLGEVDSRGTLFNEIIRIAEVKKPKIMLLENVKGLTSERFKLTFNKILSELDRIGYNVYWKLLNTQDYGVPQSRERVWFVCFRKDIDNKQFQFPQPLTLNLHIKDILETNPPINNCLSEPLQKRYACYIKDEHRVLNLQPRLGKGAGGKGPLIRDKGTAFCLDKNGNQAVIVNMNGEIKWRRLTPKEYFRLQGFLNDEINIEGISNAQCFKLASNGQSLNVVELILKEIFKCLGTD